MNSIIFYNENEALSFIEKTLLDCFKYEYLVSSNYHHNSPFNKVPSLLKHGILSKNEYLKLTGKKLSDKEKILRLDEYYANGLDYVSISATGGLDVSKREKSEKLEYISSGENEVDIIVDDSINTMRCSRNYYNELLVKGKIKRDDIITIDVRILSRILNGKNVKSIIDDFNTLPLIAKTILDDNLNIQIREATYSDDITALSKRKLVKIPRVVLK